MSILKAVAKRVIPQKYHGHIGRLRLRVSNLGISRYCPACKSFLKGFHPWGKTHQPEARCPVCGSMERDRLICLYFRRRTDLFDGRPKKLLHLAPEAQLAKTLQRAKYIDYLSADIGSPRAMIRMDITDIQLPDDVFDVIYCSHVLEHVPDDRKAMRELLRVLKPGGWAILQVPITAERTFEDPSITTPSERERIFGQHDHVRRYGKDYKDRLEEAGFLVTVDPFVRSLSQRTTRRCGLARRQDIYFCRKPAR